MKKRININRMPEQPQIQPVPISLIMQKLKLKAWQLHPLYQRHDNTWSEEDARMYIDSVETNLAGASTIVISESDKVGCILDGGHRINTIKKFVGDEDCSTNMKYIKYKDFTAHQKLEFDCISLTVVTYKNLTMIEEEELFKRINRNLQLAQGELINASKSNSICNFAHEMYSEFINVFGDKKTGLTRCNYNRMEGKSVLFVLILNFLKKKMVLYEKSGTKTNQHIEKYKDEISNEKKEVIKTKLITLFDMFKFDRSKMFQFYELITGQYIIMNPKNDQEVQRYTQFLKDVYAKNSIWFHDWRNAVNNSDESDKARVNGLNQKNIAARVKFFRNISHLST